MGVAGGLHSSLAWARRFVREVNEENTLGYILSLIMDWI